MVPTPKFEPMVTTMGKVVNVAISARASARWRQNRWVSDKETTGYTAVSPMKKKKTLAGMSSNFWCSRFWCVPKKAKTQPPVLRHHERKASVMSQCGIFICLQAIRRSVFAFFEF